MKVKFFYESNWNSVLCKIIDDEKYDGDLVDYLTLCTDALRSISDIDMELSEIEKVEKGEIKCHETRTDIFFIDVYKDRVEFSDVFEDWEDRSCTLEEYKRILLGKRAFLMLPKEIESYIEIKVNNL